MKPIFSLCIVFALALTSCEKRTVVKSVDKTAKSKAPAGMVLIPGGTFEMGTSEDIDPSTVPVRSGAKEFPPHRVILDSFYMDATEVTNAEFRKFVDATGYKTQAERPFKQEDYPKARPQDLLPAAFVLKQPKEKVDTRTTQHMAWWKLTNGADWLHPDGPGSNIEGKDDHPVVNIAYEDAEAYAKWAGKRLPTEAEWEYAARGGLDAELYPWGSELMPEGKWMANIWQGDFPNENTLDDGFKTTAPVKTYSANGFGLFDMAGNVWELVADEYQEDYYANSPKYAPKGGESQGMIEDGPMIRQRIIRGGSFLCSVGYCTGYRVAARQLSDDITSSHHTGFRLVKDTE